MEGLVLSRSVDESRVFGSKVFGSFVSPLTGRVFEGSEDVWVDGADGRPFDKDIGVEAAEKRLTSRAAKWAETDSRMAEIFNVSLRKVAVSLDDARAFSDADTKNLLSMLDMGRLVNFARSLGIDSGTKDKKLAKFIREHDGSQTIYSDFGIAKNMVVELLIAAPGLELGAFVAEKRGEDVLSIKLKSGMGEEIVDRRGASVLLSDGTLIGEPFKTKKVKDFITTKYSKILESSDDISKIVNAVEKINELGVPFTTEEHLGFFQGYEKNRLFGHVENGRRYNRFTKANSYLEEAELSGRLFAIKSLMNEVVTPGNYTEHFLSILKDNLYSQWRTEGEGGSLWWGDEEETKTISMAKTFAEAFVAGVHSLSPKLSSSVSGDIIEAAAAEAQIRVRAAAALKSMREVVLKRLEDEGKPATERRVAKQMDAYLNEHAISGSIYSRSAMDYFRKDIEDAEKLEKVKSEKTNEKTKEKVASGKFRHAAVKNGDTAFAKLRELWGSLSEDAIKHLFFVATESASNKSEFSEWILADDSRTEKLMSLMSDPHLWFDVKCKDRILEIASEKGPESLVFWGWLNESNVESLVTKIPDDHVTDALKLITKNIKRYQSQNSDSALDVLLGRLGKADGISTVKENIDEISGVISSSSPSSVKVIWKHLKRWGFKKGDKDYASAYLAAAIGAGETDEVAEMIDGSGDDFDPIKFAAALKKGQSDAAVEVAKRLIDKAKTRKEEADEADGRVRTRYQTIKDYELVSDDDEGEPWQRLQNRFLRRVVNGEHYHRSSVDVKTLFSVDEVALTQEGALAILDFAELTEVADPCGMDRLKNIFKVAGITRERQVELVGKFFGEGGSEWVLFVEESGGMERDEIVKAICRRASKTDRSYGSGDYALNEASLKYFEDIVALNPNFVNSGNISRLKDDQIAGLSTSTLSQALKVKGGILSKTSGGSSGRISSLGSYLRIFRFSEEYSMKFLVESASLTPKQAVRVAKSLHPSAVKKCSAKIFEVLKGKKDDLDEIAHLLDMDELDESQAKLMKSLPSNVATRIIAGDTDIADSEWLRFFADDNAVKKVIFWAFGEGKSKLIKQVKALADTYDANVASSFLNVFKTVAPNLAVPGSDLELLKLLADLGGVESVEVNYVLDVILKDEIDYIDPTDPSSFEPLVIHVKKMAKLLGGDWDEISKEFCERMFNTLHYFHKRIDVSGFTSLLSKVGVLDQFKKHSVKEIKSALESCEEESLRKNSYSDLSDDIWDEKEENEEVEEDYEGDENESVGSNKVKRKATFSTNWTLKRTPRGIKNRIENLRDLADLIGVK